VIFDATANLRRYRDAVRAQIPRFCEVYVDCPLETCLERDPKGIYRQAQEGGTGAVPGLQAVYEPPLAPEVIVRNGEEPVEHSAQRIVAKLKETGFICA
jgi:adenylylsulfate kinase-like enzyme